jgi:hypothetical protein
MKFGYKPLFRPRVRQLQIICGGVMGAVDEKLGSFIVNTLFKSLREEKLDLVVCSDVKPSMISGLDQRQSLNRAANWLTRDRAMSWGPRNE